MKQQFTIIFIFLMMFIGVISCKQEWLEAKPNKALVVPSTIMDYQSLLDNTGGTGGLSINQPSMTMVGDGDYIISDATFNALRTAAEKGAYTWAPTDSFFGGSISGEWRNVYAQILQTNVVLDGISKLNLDPSTQMAFDNVKGSALFFRGFYFFNLSQQFCKVYDDINSENDLGLPLRISSNVNIQLNRASVKETYNQIIKDVTEAVPLLPVTPLFPTRPSKQGAYGLLARIYLSQGKYKNALAYADSCLQLQSALMDYNQLNLSLASPIVRLNAEIIFHSQLTSFLSANPPNLIVDPVLFSSYDINDLRRTVFFINTSSVNTLRTSYAGSSFLLFGGLATDEMYLIRAECNAREGNVAVAMNDLNLLLKNRWKTGTYINQTASNADAALTIILTERRKELCFRNLRWIDLRRLNKETRFQTTLSRTVNGQVFTLLPNSSRYVLPIDDQEILLGGLQQNPR